MPAAGPSAISAAQDAAIVPNGNTYPLKATLKAAEFLFAPKKVAWYFRTAEYKVGQSSGKSLDEIRNKYGSEALNDDKPKQRTFINNTMRP